MELDALFLSRIQFAFTVSFHIIFPAFTIGLSAYLALVEWKYLKTGKEVYKEIYLFLIKVFAVAFGMGVVSGIVMSYQFGTNWSTFSDKAGSVIGPLLAYEVLTAFFLEASFLGIMLFGWDKVSRKMHFVATLLVAIGTAISAFWILSANSWMQTPAGFEINEEGLFMPTNWIEVIFNPSMPYRLVHMLTAAYLTTGFVIGGVASWFLLKNRHVTHAKKMLKHILVLAFFVAPFQLFVGDLHGLNVYEHQPLKAAAIEAVWDTQKGAPLQLFAWPSEEQEKNLYSIAIPKGASFILTHDTDAEIKGLKDWPKEDRPPVAIVFWSFRIMVGLGLLMIFAGVAGAWLYYKDKLYSYKPYLRFMVAMGPSGFIAVLAGWFVAEVGRQPYTIYGFLRTSESASPILSEQVAFSLALFIIIYTLIFGSGTAYILNLFKKGITDKPIPPIPAKAMAFEKPTASKTKAKKTKSGKKKTTAKKSK